MSIFFPSSAGGIRHCSKPGFPQFEPAGGNCLHLGNDSSATDPSDFLTTQRKRSRRAPRADLGPQPTERHLRTLAPWKAGAFKFQWMPSDLHKSPDKRRQTNVQGERLCKRTATPVTVSEKLLNWRRSSCQALTGAKCVDYCSSSHALHSLKA